MRTGKKIFSGCTALAGALFLAGHGLAQPSNDAFANRLVLSGDRVLATGANAGATLEVAEPFASLSSAGATVWWSWTAPGAGRFAISTAGSAFDTLLGLYRGETFAELQQVAFNDDEDTAGGVFTSRLAFAADAGVTYQIVVGGFKDNQGRVSSGSIRLEIAPDAGSPAPVWEARDLEGNLVNAADFAGKVVLLDFWATWCGPCRAEAPVFVELQQQYGPAGLVIVGVSVDSTGPDVVKEFEREFAINYPIVMTNPKIEEAFGGITSIPTAFLIDRDQQLVFRHSGFGNQPFWEERLRPLLAATSGVALAIAKRGDQIRVSWPAGTLPFVLESSDNFSPARWQRVIAGIEASEGINSVSFSGTQPAAFFRLKME